MLGASGGRAERRLVDVVKEEMKLVSVKGERVEARVIIREDQGT